MCFWDKTKKAVQLSTAKIHNTKSMLKNYNRTEFKII